jgi:hypothetical protein
MASADMIYNGTTLDWTGQGVFKATSGLTDHQNASEQTHADEGPIPEGLYWFPLIIGKDATMVGPGVLDDRQGIERLPATFHFGDTDYENFAWGPDRVRLNVVQISDPKAYNRDGFYLHDSTKGFSHGCIEVDPHFFLKLRDFVAMPAKKRGGQTRLIVKVKYPSSSASTYGGTKVP